MQMVGSLGHGEGVGRPDGLSTETNRSGQTLARTKKTPYGRGPPSVRVFVASGEAARLANLGAHGTVRLVQRALCVRQIDVQWSLVVVVVVVAVMPTLCAKFKVPSV